MQLIVRSAGNSFAETLAGTDGDMISWSMRIKKPLPLTLKSRLTVDGDKIAGTTDVGGFASFAIEGIRV